MKSNFDNKNYILTTTEPIKLISSPIISNRNMNPLHPVGYLGSAILTKGKTGLGSLQQPLKELYSMYVQKSGSKAQQRLLIISTEGLTFQWNDSGVEKFINNSLSSVYDVQLLKIVSEKRKDKKFYCAFLPMGEETDPRYSNLFLQLDKQHQRAFESSSETCHPSIIALIMRRSQGIQALECHVLITRSGCEANQIVNCIRSACSKYKFNVSQQTDVFQYKPYTVDNNNNINYENHVDLITGLNTSSNAVSLMGQKEKLKKTKEVNLGIKNNQSLLSKLKANLKENNFMHKNKDVVGMPPLPARKNISSNIKLTSSNEDTTAATSNKKSILCSASARDITNRVENDESKKAKSNSVRIVTEKIDNSKKQKSKISACSAVSFDEEKSGDSKKLASSSTTSINKQEKKLSLGKRLLLSARSSIKGSKLSNSSTTISKNEKSLNNYDYIHKNVSDIDFRRSSSTSKNKTNDARLVDANMMYPFVQQPVRTISTLNVINNDIQQQQNRFIPPKYVNPKIGQNFILKSKSSASPIIVQRQHVRQQTTNNNSPSSIGFEKKLTSSYQSTPSLVVVTTENHNNNLQQKQQQRFISRSPSTTSINNNNKFQNRTSSVTSVPIGRESRRPTPIMGTNYHAQYVRNCSSHAASQSDINNIITTRTKLKSPLEDPKLMSTHLVWNKNSKSAENLDSNHTITTEIHSTSNINNNNNNNNNVRAVSPISSINSIYTTTTTNQNLSASRENLNQSEQNVITYKNSTKIRDSPMIQKGPLNKTVIVVRNDDYFIQPETVTTTTTTTTTQLGNKQQQQQNDTENYNSLRKSSSRLDLVEEQERCISNASMKSFTSSGIKLVPAYTYEMNEAAIQRRNRLREIEENLYKDSPVSFHQMCHQTPTERSSEYYHFNQETEYSDNDHEVIDLTKQARLNAFNANKSVDLPIEIFFTNQQNNNNNNNVSSRIINMEPFENDFNHQISRAHSNYENNQTTSNRSVHQSNTSSTQQQYFSELDNNKQINYVYYYGSNEDFGGY